MREGIPAPACLSPHGPVRCRSGRCRPAHYYSTRGKPYYWDEILLSGTSANSNIIAIYLFVTGPGLDARGVCLENLNLPAGQGYFTSASVNPDGTWHYAWNTAFLSGRLVPGTYTVYVVNVPLGLNRLGKMAMATTNVTFTGRKELELAPGNPTLCSGALLIVGLILSRVRR